MRGVRREFLRAEAVRKRFDRLRRAWNDPPQPEVHDALRYVQVRAIGEDELAEWITERLRSRTTGAEPATVAAVLAQLADDSVHQELSAADVWTHPATPVQRPVVDQTCGDPAKSSRPRPDPASE